jgi:hypothetical protein
MCCGQIRRGKMLGEKIVRIVSSFFLVWPKKKSKKVFFSFGQLSEIK